MDGKRGLFRARVVSSEQVSPSTYIVSFERPEGFPGALPGQFVSVRVRGATTPLLRRPFSIMDLDDRSLVLLVKVIGEGTRILASARAGEEMDIAGPLGSVPFTPPEGSDAVFVAGGTGLAPMIFAARQWKREGSLGGAYLMMGAATADELQGKTAASDFTEIHESTIDGSSGYEGDVVQMLRLLLDDGKIKAGRLYSCGPRGMVEALEKKVSGSFDVHQTSLEAVMACGVGACRGCTVPLNTGGETVIRSVCADGTVFDASQIAWEDWKE